MSNPFRNLNLKNFRFFKLVLSPIVFFNIQIAIADNQNFNSEKLLERIKLLEEKLSKLEQKDEKNEQEVKAIASEIEDRKLDITLPKTKELKSVWGFAPGASSIYNQKEGVSLGGYGEVFYQDFVNGDKDKKSIADALRLVTYFGYKFSDSILINSEIEFEHGTTDGIGAESGDSRGEVSVEFLYLDFMNNKVFNTRAGLVLIPLGFVNEIHEPPFFFGVQRPQVERFLIPSTWRETGFGFFGEGDLAGKLEYRTYLTSSLRAKRFSSDEGIREGRQSGNKSLAEDLALSGRLDYSPDSIKGLTAGGAFFVGDASQGEIPESDVATRIFDAHLQYHYKNLKLRALYVNTTIDDTQALNQVVGSVVGEKQDGYYLEAGYNILPSIIRGTTQDLSPFFRYENYDLQKKVATGSLVDGDTDNQLYTFGLNYKPINNVAIKADYTKKQRVGNVKPSDIFSLGLGFVF